MRVPACNRLKTGTAPIQTINPNKTKVLSYVHPSHHSQKKIASRGSLKCYAVQPGGSLHTHDLYTAWAWLLTCTRPESVEGIKRCVYADNWYTVDIAVCCDHLDASLGLDLLRRRPNFAVGPWLNRYKTLMAFFVSMFHPLAPLSCYTSYP